MCLFYGVPNAEMICLERLHGRVSVCMTLRNNDVYVDADDDEER